MSAFTSLHVSISCDFPGCHRDFPYGSAKSVEFVRTRTVANGWEVNGELDLCPAHKGHAA